MANEVSAKIEGDELVIRLPLYKEARESASGKTLVVASTHGNKTTEAEFNGEKIIIGVNGYIYKSRKGK